MNKIDIIIPIYNAKDSIENCVNSARRQTLKEIGIILIDDGSNDGSSEICDRLAKLDSRIITIHIKNGGVSNARNIGILNSSSEYIQFLDSDDNIEYNMCKKLYNKAIKYNADIVACGFVYETNGIKIKQVKYKGEFLTKQKFSDSFGTFYTSGYAHVIWNKIYKKNCIKEYFDTNISLGEDLQFNLDVFKNISSIYCIEECLYHYSYMNSIGLTRKKQEKYFELKTKEFDKVEKFAVGFLKCNEDTIKYINSIIYRDIHTIIRTEYQTDNFLEIVSFWQNYLNKKYNKTKGIKSKLYRHILLSYPHFLKILIKLKI